MTSDKVKNLSPDQLADEVVQAYLELGDTIRLTILPGWMIAQLTISQLKALFLLAHHKALAISELAHLLNLSNPAASTLVQQLVDQSLVERSEDSRDRRRTLVRLTAQGTEMINVRRKQTQIRLRGWLSQMSHDELADLAHGLSALLRVMRAEHIQENQIAPDAEAQA